MAVVAMRQVEFHVRRERSGFSFHAPQTATTSEMNWGVGEAAAEVADIGAGIESLAPPARLSTESLADSQRAVEELARMPGELQSLVGRFGV
jgi:methyl-accepting chemotaxis protein